MIENVNLNFKTDIKLLFVDVSEWKIYIEDNKRDESWHRSIYVYG